MAIGDVIGIARIAVEPDMSGFAKSKAAIAAAGAAVGATIIAGITEAMDQANITSTLQAQLGTSGKVAADQGKIAGKLYSSGVSGSFQEAADAIKTTVQSGLAPPGTTNAQLQSIATKAQDVATVFGQDLGGVTNSVSQLIRTGLAKNSTEAFDILTKGFQSGADKAGDLLDTVNEYGTQFRKAGVDGGQMVGILQQGLQAGARDADIVADSIKEFSLRAVDGSKLTADGFKALGLNADDMAGKFAKGGKTANAVLDLTLDRLRGIKDPVKQSQIAVSLFGTQAEDLGAALYAIDPSEATKKIGNLAGSTAAMGKTLRSGPSYEITVFTRRMKQAFVEVLGNQVLPVITRFAQWVNTYIAPPLTKAAVAFGAILVPALTVTIRVISSVVKWFAGLVKSIASLGEWLIPIGIAVAGFTAVILAQQIATAGVTAAFSIYRGVILAWSAVTRIATGVQIVFNAVMSANPIGIVIVAIVALVAAVIIAYKKFETFRNVVNFVFNWIKDHWKLIVVLITGPIGAAVLLVIKYWDQISGAAKAAFDWVKDHWKLIVGLITGPIGAAVLLVITYWDQIVDGLKTALDAVVGFFKSLPGWILGAVGDLGKLLYNSGKFVLQGFIDGLYFIAVTIPVWIVNHVHKPIIMFFINAALWLVDSGRKILTGLLSGAAAISSTITSWLTAHVFKPLIGYFINGLIWLVSAGRKIISGLLSGAGAVSSTITGWMTRNVYQPVINSFLNGINWLVSSGRKIISGLLSGAGSVASTISTWISKNIKAPIVNAFTNGLSWLTSSGSNIISGLWSGFIAKWKEVNSWVRSLKKKIVDAIVDVFDIGSPAKSMIPLGIHIIAGLMKGMLSSGKALKSVARSLFHSVTDVFKRGGGLVGDLFGNIGSAIGLGDSSAVGSAQQYAQLALKTFGWGPSQWPALKALWNGESGWNYKALNASSGAYGIPQSLPASKMASAGADWRTNPATQIRWGLDYIKRTYGSPTAAYAAWLRRSPHWYDTGGVAYGAGFIPKLTNAPERILSPRQTALFERMITGRGPAAVPTGTTLVIDKLILENHGVIGSQLELENWMVTSLTSLKRKGRI